MRAFLHLLRQAVVNTVQDGCFSVAKGAAYSLILTFFPTLMVLTAILAGNHRTAALMREITYALGRVLPPTAQQEALQTAVGGHQTPLRLLISAASIALLASAGVMASFIQGFRAVYRMQNTWSFWKEEGISMALVFLAGAPLLAATALIVFGAQVRNWLAYEFGFPILVTVVWSAVRWVVAIGTCTLVLGIIYYVGPNLERKFVHVLPGALVATLAWLGTTAIFGWYVQNVAEYSGIYGSLGAGIALLIWMYLLSCIVLVGAEFNAAYERHRRNC